MCSFTITHHIPCSHNTYARASCDPAVVHACPNRPTNDTAVAVLQQDQLCTRCERWARLAEKNRREYDAARRSRAAAQAHAGREYALYPSMLVVPGSAAKDRSRSRSRDRSASDESMARRRHGRMFGVDVSAMPRSVSTAAMVQ